MEMKFYLVFITALIPLLVGMIWYNKNVFGKPWMQATGITEQDAKGMNMIVVFLLTYVFGVMISVAMMTIVIHQMSVGSVFQGDESQVAKDFLKNFFENYGTRFRTFKHGVLHGVISAIFIGLPLIGISAMFERRNWKYILITLGYWIVCFALIGGILCQYL